MSKGENRGGFVTLESILEVRQTFARKYGFTPLDDDFKIDSANLVRIKPAIEYIEAFYDRPITLDDIAKASGLSVFRLAHIFKEQLGVTMVDYLTHARLRRAKTLLVSTDKKCSKICFEVGYSNQSYFNRIFKELAGVTPRQYRVNNS